MDDDHTLRAVAVICLAAVLLAAITGMTVVAVVTDRDLWKVEVLTFAGVLLLVLTGGVSWSALTRHRRRRWHVSVDRNGHDDKENPDDPDR